jgi:voltage-gated potassium channel
MNGFDPASSREKIFRIVFGTETEQGRLFDIVLIFMILFSVTVVMLESVLSLSQAYGPQLRTFEWFFTIMFTVEYAIRLWCVKKPKGYAFSFFGIVDLLSVLPTWFSLVIPGAQVTAIIRVLRVIRVFRILKLVQYLGGTDVLLQAISRSRYRITVFLVAVSVMVTILGSFMYLIEGHDNGFTSIPAGVYWAIVTLTTVGYGDIAPSTPFGQILASFLMLMGYALIAVPMGLIISETSKRGSSSVLGSRQCNRCANQISDPEKQYCSYCGRNLDRVQMPSL